MFFCTTCGRCYSFRRSSLCVFVNPRNWIPRWGRWCFRIWRICSRFGLLGVCRWNRLLPDRRSQFTHRWIYLWLALQRIARSCGNRRIFCRCRSGLLGLSGLLVLWNRFRSGFPLRFGFCFRQPVGCLFCQMAGFLHGMVGGVCDLAALVAILRLPILCSLAQLLPKLLKGSVRAAAECCLRRGFERFGCALLQQPFFFDLLHYDACSTRSDSFVVISWYSLPFFGK